MSERLQHLAAETASHQQHAFAQRLLSEQMAAELSDAKRVSSESVARAKAQQDRLEAVMVTALRARWLSRYWVRWKHFVSQSVAQKRFECVRFASCEAGNNVLCRWKTNSDVASSLKQTAGRHLATLCLACLDRQRRKQLQLAFHTWTREVCSH